jgi:hypothetical protein
MPGRTESPRAPPASWSNKPPAARRPLEKPLLYQLPIEIKKAIYEEVVAAAEPILDYQVVDPTGGPRVLRLRREFVESKRPSHLLGFKSLVGVNRSTTTEIAQLLFHQRLFHTSRSHCFPALGRALTALMNVMKGVIAPANFPSIYVEVDVLRNARLRPWDDLTRSDPLHHGRAERAPDDVATEMSNTVTFPSEVTVILLFRQLWGDVNNLHKISKKFGIDERKRLFSFPTSGVPTDDDEPFRGSIRDATKEVPKVPRRTKPHVDDGADDADDPDDASLSGADRVAKKPPLSGAKRKKTTTGGPASKRTKSNRRRGGVFSTSIAVGSSH